MTEKWSVEGPRITEPQLLQRVRDTIERQSPVIVEHRYYQGARAPSRFVCEEVDEFEEYLRSKASTGDSFFVWNFEECCNEAKALVRGKFPDREGRTPSGGAY